MSLLFLTSTTLQWPLATINQMSSRFFFARWHWKLKKVDCKFIVIDIHYAVNTFFFFKSTQTKSRFEFQKQIVDCVLRKSHNCMSQIRSKRLYDMNNLFDLCRKLRALCMSFVEFSHSRNFHFLFSLFSFFWRFEGREKNQ